RRPVLREDSDPASRNCTESATSRALPQGRSAGTRVDSRRYCQTPGGLAPADLQAICTAAKRMAFNRMSNSDQLPPLNWSDFERATERVRGDMAQLDNTGLQ